MPSIQTFLVRLVLLVWVPSLAVSIVLIWYGYDRVKFRVQESTLISVRALAAGIDAKIYEISNGLQALGSSPELAKGDLSSFERHARDFVSSGGFAVNIVLVDRSGTEVKNTIRTMGDQSPSVTTHPEFRRLLQEGNLAVTNLFVDPLIGAPIVAVGVPRRELGEVKYVVAAGIDPSDFAKVLLAQRLPSTWIVALIDGQNIIVSRLPRQGQFVGQPATADFQRMVKASNEGTHFGVSKDGTPVLAVFSRAPVSGYVVVVGVPEQEILGPVRRTVAVVGAVMCILLGLVLTAALAMSRRLTASARDLAQAATRVGRADMKFATGSLFQEDDQVRLGLNIASIELQEAGVDRELFQQMLSTQTLAALRQTLQAATEPMLLLDEEGTVLCANSAAADLFRMDMQLLSGSQIWDLVERSGASDTEQGHLQAVGRRADGTTVDLIVKRSSVLVGDDALFVASLRVCGGSAQRLGDL